MADQNSGRGFQNMNDDEQREAARRGGQTQSGRQGSDDR